MAKVNKTNDAAWTALHRAFRRGNTYLEARLKSAGAPDLDTLAALRLLADKGVDLSAKQIEKDLLLPQYGVSRLLDRMEQDGLIARNALPADKRIKLVRLSKKGAESLRAALTEYESALADFWSARMRPGQSSRLCDLLAHLDRDDA
ncbi:MAG: MarR family transcriptional regulator [Pseudomonadota bacterium]